MRIARVWIAVILCLVGFSSARAAPLAPGTAFLAVTLDGVRLGEDFTPNFDSLFPTVVFDPSTNIFQLWALDGSGFQLSAVRHATSVDGVHFTSTGNLSYAGGPPFPGFGAATEPEMVFLRAAMVANDWKLLMWTGDDPSGGNGQYDYNISVNDIGANPNNLSVTHQGPVQPATPSGVFGQAKGPFGLIGGLLFFEYDNVGGVGRYGYTDSAPPAVAGSFAAADLITGTGFVYGLSNPGDPLAVYVHNVGRTIDQLDGTLGTYYSLRFWQTGARVNKQIYYAESVDGGANWGPPVGLFADGNLVTVDGNPNQENFSHPEAITAGGSRFLYMSTRAGDGHFVVATNVVGFPVPVPVVTVPTASPAGLALLIAGLLLAAWTTLRRAA